MGPIQLEMIYMSLKNKLIPFENKGGKTYFFSSGKLCHRLLSA